MHGLDRCGLRFSRVTPDGPLHILSIGDRIDFRVLLVGEEAADGLVVARVSEVGCLEGAIGRRSFHLLGFLSIGYLLRAYLWEVPVQAESGLGIVEGASLLDCRSVGPLWLQDLPSLFYVVLALGVLLVLIEVFSVGGLLLEHLVGEAGEEILELLRLGADGRAVVLVLEF